MLLFHVTVPLCGQEIKALAQNLEMEFRMR